MTTFNNIYILFLHSWIKLAILYLYTLSVLTFAHSRKHLKNERKLAQLLRAKGVCAKINTREK